jgi:hypothetical protein
MMSQFDLTTIESFKDFINKDSTNTDNDEKIKRFISKASGHIETFCKRKLRGRSYTEFQDGSGSRNYYPRQYPVISITSMHDDNSRSFAADTLKPAADYIVDNNSLTIVLSPVATFGQSFAKGVLNVKLVYKAGYDEFIIEEDVNDIIDFVEDGNPGAGTFACQLDAGTYTAATLATEIKTQMDAAGANVYTVTYNPRTGKFEIETDSTSIQLLWDSGDSSYKTPAAILGWEEDDTTAANPQTSDFGVLGIPADLQLACNMITARIYNDSDLGGRRLDVKRKSAGGPVGAAGTTEYLVGEFNPKTLAILEKYERALS